MRSARSMRVFVARGVSRRAIATSTRAPRRHEVIDEPEPTPRESARASFVAASIIDGDGVCTAAAGLELNGGDAGEAGLGREPS